MQYALSIEDSRTWEAEQFSRLPDAEIELRRRNLVCAQCGEFAWFRRQSRHGHPAHFCAHHLENCDLRVNYIVVGTDRQDATVSEQEVSAGENIVVRLDHERGNAVDVTPVFSPPSPGQGQGGRSFIIRDGDRQSSQQFTLRRILLRLVQSPTFRNSRQQITLFKNQSDILINGAIRDVAINFEQIDDQLHDRTALYWGPIASAGRTQDGRLWLNASDSYQGVSVAIFADIADDFLDSFEIDDLEELAGAHVLVAGRCTIAATGKPIIWCGSEKYIIVRRYIDARLQARV